MQQFELFNLETWRQWGQHPQMPRVVAALFFFFALLVALQLWTYFSLRPHFSLPTTSARGSAPIDLASLHLFGSYDITYSNLPETNLNLMLQGTVVIPGSDQGVAIMMVNGQPAGTYQVGEQVLGANIVKIFLDRVVLKYDGTLQSLSLPIKKLPNISTPSYDSLANHQESE